MISQLFLAVAVVVLRAAASTCPMYTCDKTLALTTCVAWVSTGSYSINSAGCKTGYYCSEIAAAAWAEGYTGIGGIDAFYPCSPVMTMNTSTAQVGVWSYVDCYMKDANKAFVNGGTVVACKDSSDCLLVDNTKTTCSCSFRSDGLGICDPDPRNPQIFADYYAKCGANNRLTDENAYIYWSLYMQLWKYEQSSLACTSIFIEKHLLSAAYSNYNAAGWLAASGLLAIVY